MRRSTRLVERGKNEKEEKPPVSVGIETVDNKDDQRPTTSKTTANKIISTKSGAKGNRHVSSPTPEPVKGDLAEEKRKRLRLSADQRTLLDATSILAPPPNTPSWNPLSIDHVIDRVFGFIFPGPEKENYNLAYMSNFRLVCHSWNRAGVRLLKRHCRIGVGSLESADTDQFSSNAEHDIEEQLTLAVPPITLNLPVKSICKYISVMKRSADVPFVMYSLREGLFSEANARAFVELLQVVGPSMEQLLVTMEPSSCTMSFLTPYFQLGKLKRLKIMMKRSKTDNTASALRQFRVNERIYPIDGINGIYFLQTLCNAAVALDRLDIHWMPTSITWSSTFGLKDLYLPKTITKLTLSTMNTDGATVKNLLLHKDVRLSILKWSIGIPLQSITAEDVEQCLTRHSKTLKSLYFSIWISHLYHEGTKLVVFPTMPNVEQVSLMGEGVRITPFSFGKVFPKLSSLTLCNQMLDCLGEGVPSKTVKVVRILGGPIRCDVGNMLAKAFPELETFLLVPQQDLYSKEYLVSMFGLMAKLRILLAFSPRSDASAEANNSDINMEEILPNGLHVRTYRWSTFIIRIESGSEVTRAVAEANEHLHSISKNPPFYLDAAAFSD